MALDPLTVAIFNRLNGDATLTALLAASVIGTGAKAIYSTLPVPPTATMPFVVANASSVTDEPDDPADRATFRDIVRDIHAYAAKPDHGGGSAETVNAIADRIRLLFHQQPLTLTDASGAYAKNLDCQVSGPMALDDAHAFGRVLSLRLRVQSLVPSS